MTAHVLDRGFSSLPIPFGWFAVALSNAVQVPPSGGPLGTLRQFGICCTPPSCDDCHTIGLPLRPLQQTPMVDGAHGGTGRSDGIFTRLRN